MKRLAVIALFIPFWALAQNDRIADENDIVWGQIFSTISLGGKWDLLAEYQWRRTNGLKHWQQSLARTALQYRLNEQLSVAAGYGWIETFEYGDFPLAANGTFPEHRLHQQVQMRNRFGRLLVNQRLRIEQRWVGRRELPGREIAEWVFSHRFRPMLRLQYPVATRGNQQLYIAAADEVFIGAGKNVGANLLDQNRIILLGGFRISKRFSIEAGYMNQTLVQGRRINGNTIVQDNNGAVLALVTSF